METTHNIKFIDGIFTPTDAWKVLFTLINEKINYHQMELFSNEERFGIDLAGSKKRIEELTGILSSIKKVVDAASEKAKVLKLNGFVEIIMLNEEFLRVVV